jgi:PKD repeat protein
LNINNLRLGFQWVNNNDGTGTDPSFAVNYVRLTTPSQVSSNFNMSNTSSCQGECITFTDASTGGANSWLWDFGDGSTSTDQDPVHCFTISGNFNCQLTVSNGASSNTSSQVLTINPAPGVGLSYQDGTVSALDNNAFYQWVLCPSMVAIPGATSQTYTPTINASYAVIVLNASGCSDTSQCITVSDLSLNENNPSGPTVFPNPFANAFELSGLPENTAFRLMTTDGKVVMHGYSGLQPVECGQLSAGCYFLSVDGLPKERVILLIKE